LETRFSDNEVEVFELILNLIQTFDVIELERLDEVTREMNLDEAKNYINGLKISPSRLNEKVKEEEAPVANPNDTLSNDTNGSPPEEGINPEGPPEDSGTRRLNFISKNEGYARSGYISQDIHYNDDGNAALKLKFQLEYISSNGTDIWLLVNFTNYKEVSF
jgi:hypothetical protein